MRLWGAGRPLPEAERASFESRFGHDFGGVRIHADSQAARSAHRLNALAYTVGNNIVFGQGQFAPASPAGQRLLAHELAHVVQQRRLGQPVVQRKIDDISMRGCDIGIRMSIGLYGSRSTVELAEQWQQWINSEWSKEVICEETPHTCPVTMDATVRSYSTAEHAWQVPESNRVFVEKPGFRSMAFARWGRWAVNESDPRTIAHETGHLMGLLDRYWWVGAMKSMRGFESDIMGDYPRDPRPTEYHGALARILRRRGLECPCCVPGSPEAVVEELDQRVREARDAVPAGGQPAPRRLDPAVPGSTAVAGAAPASRGSVAVQPMAIGFGPADPIHDPLLEEYRRASGQPPGGVDPSGRQVGPTDAELKYGGVLLDFFAARWLPATFDRRNAAKVWFESTPLLGSPGGLTTPVINGQEIEDNFDVEAAIPSPAIQSRAEGGQTACWFASRLNVTGRSHMDIFSAGPWDHVVSRAQASSRFSWEPACQTGGDVTIHLDGDPSDQALETFIREGEAEHDQDMGRAFYANIQPYVSTVNEHVGDSPRARVTAPNQAACERRLRTLENRDLLTQFVLDINQAGAIRHAGGRHSVTVSQFTIDPTCSRVKVRMDAGTL